MRVKVSGVLVAAAIIVGAWAVVGLARQAPRIGSVRDAADLCCWLFEDTTTWASDYQEAAFLRLRPGMTERQVLGMLGQPLQVSRTRGTGERWLWYTVGAPDANYWMRIVVVDGMGRVSAVKREYWVD
jgi:hypothetical protein